ncbi:hypothetical protein VCHA53O466_50489 [Vibrio chagasii]|nr:hypothetical protein VCHA53O466_50489 [Vibrio chagasii]
MIELKKHPKTYHHPLSLSVNNDDKVIRVDDLNDMIGLECIASYKLDGECTTIYPNSKTHARSIDSKYHPSRTWIRSYAAKVGYLIPDGLRVCGENLTAVHSIEYQDLGSYFFAFGVWRGDKCLNWDESIETLKHCGIEPVEVLWRGELTQDKIKELWGNLDTQVHEGLVFRVVEEFDMAEYSKKVFKLVRSNHVQTDKHWMKKEVVFNKLKQN